MKPNKPPHGQNEIAAERMLYQAVLALETVEEAEDFFRDLCTPAELQAMTDRWSIVDPLLNGASYRDIASSSGVSVTTVGRVARFLTQGNGGYQRVHERLKDPVK